MMHKQARELRAAWLSGELIPGVKFRYNSIVNVRLEGGEAAQGWIVGVELASPEPVYTVEIKGGNPYVELVESSIESVCDSQEQA